jgi:hypothetical protein
MNNNLEGLVFCPKCTVILEACCCEAIEEFNSRKNEEVELETKIKMDENDHCLTFGE